MNPKTKKRIFESLTVKQAMKLERLPNETPGMDEDTLKSMILDLTGIPFIYSLSKQEAAFIIGKATGCTKWNRPLPAWTGDEFTGDPSLYPTCGQIHFIREAIHVLGWNHDRFTSWLQQCAKARDINELNRETAKKALVGLMQIRIKRMES